MPPAPGAPFRRVLVAWDGSPDSVTALRTAAAIIGPSGVGHVVALAVLTAPPRQEGDQQAAGASAQAHHVQTVFETTRASITTPAKITLHTLEASHAPGPVCDYATEHGFDLLIVGRHGDGGLIHPKLGHVAEAVAKTCRTPVLLVSAG